MGRHTKVLTLPVYEKENTELKPVKIRLKLTLCHILLLLEGLDKYVYKLFIISRRAYLSISMIDAPQSSWARSHHINLNIYQEFTLSWGVEWGFFLEFGEAWPGIFFFFFFEIRLLFTLNADFKIKLQNINRV